MPTASRNPVITIERAGTDEQSFIDVFELLVALHKEGGFAPLKGEKAAREVYSVLTEGMTFIARTADGMAVGVLCLTESPFYYSDETFLHDRGFYVRPRYRKGKVGQMLLKAATEEADRRGRLAFVNVTNPDRRPKKNGATLMAITAGYVPMGYLLKLR